MTMLACSAEIWKRDLRTKQGIRKVETIDYVDLTKEEVQAKMNKLFPANKANKANKVKIFDTYVTYVNRPVVWSSKSARHTDVMQPSV